MLNKKKKLVMCDAQLHCVSTESHVVRASGMREKTEAGADAWSRCLQVRAEEQESDPTGSVLKFQRQTLKIGR